MQGDGVTDVVRPGERFGRFTVLSELASGGMGRVYLARSPGGRTVAVKTLITDSEDDRRRFAREVALAQRVRGVFTASIVEADTTADVPWMAQEYVPAPSLKGLVEGCGTLGADAVYWVAAGMAEALVCLHDAGLVHRDVKPSNVLLPVEGPRLIDFGISQAHDLTRTQTALGTVAYASPEQARGERTTGASDVFSLGATLFYLAVGRPPYRDMGSVSALEQLVRAAAGETDVSGLPPELAVLVLPCLALDPAGRPTPAQLLAHCADRLGSRPAARGGGDWLDPRWTEAIDRYRARRDEALEVARRRVDPDAGTAPVPTPSRTTRWAAPPGPAGGTGSRRRTVGAAVAAAAVVVLAVVLAVRPWESSEENKDASVPDEPVRFLEVEREYQGICPGASGRGDPYSGAATETPAPDGRAFAADDRSVCAVVSTAPGLTVNRFKKVYVREAEADSGMQGWMVNVVFEEADTVKFAELTRKVSARARPANQLAVVQGDDRLLANVAIVEPLTSGNAVIASRLGRNEADFLARTLGAP
ncbi:protein kinase domain-containing protein [Streptomyces sp. NPDC054802]